MTDPIKQAIEALAQYYGQMPREDYEVIHAALSEPVVDVEALKWSVSLAVAPSGNHTELSGYEMVLIGKTIDHLAAQGYLRGVQTEPHPVDQDVALKYFNALWCGIEKYMGVDPECAHFPHVIRNAIMRPDATDQSETIKALVEALELIYTSSPSRNIGDICEQALALAKKEQG